MNRHISIVILFFMAATASHVGALEFPGPQPGAAHAEVEQGRLTLKNAVLSVTWDVEKQLEVTAVADLISKTYIPTPEQAPLMEGINLRFTSRPGFQRFDQHRLGGLWSHALLESADGKVHVKWEAVLHDGSNYVRQQWTIEAKDRPASELVLLKLKAEGAKVMGEVEGSPVVAGNLFFGCEHPMANNRVEGQTIMCSVGTFRALKEGQSCIRSCVIGVAAPGQLRRSFQYYLERERPRAYKPFLHYNSWYDIAWGDRKMNEAQCVQVVEAFAEQLIGKRGVKLDSFVFDDGWDDNKTLWRFHQGFPNGFTPVRAAAEKCGSSVGVWLSPWGGYGQAKEERMKFGATQGFETNKAGFALSGPKYYGRFRDVCVEMIEKYGVNYFKFDGIAQGISSKGAGSEYAGDVEALLSLLKELRQKRPDVYLSITTGTWPSPWWVFYGDSIWRNGGDMGFGGVGSKRQQWITYRDAIEYQWIVKRAPLYPINSLMTQGIAQANLGDASVLGSDLKEWKDEVRSFFGSGTQLQELYITPAKLSPQMWDVLAEGAKWSRKNAEILADVHWVGGDPGKGECYGFAAWSGGKGILMLRNPSDKLGQINIDIGQAFELPPGVPQQYRLHSPWSEDRDRPTLVLKAGQLKSLKLEGFETIVGEAEATE